MTQLIIPDVKSRFREVKSVSFGNNDNNRLVIVSQRLSRGERLFVVALAVSDGKWFKLSN